MDILHFSCIFSAYFEAIISFSLSLSVNNVGVLHGTPLYYSEMSENDIWDMINVNIGAMSMMTRIVLPSMLRRQRGAIVNLSSLSAMKPIPLLGMYAATKV